MAVTLLQNLINPQVLSDMISYELTKKLRLTGFYKVERTLTGRAGDTITVPAWKYIGMAADVAENAEVPVRQMDTEDISYTVKKAAVDVRLTDESVLSGYGDPMGETAKQLRLSIQDKMEYDGVQQLRNINNANGLFYETSDAISYDTVVEALDLFNTEEQGETLFLMVNQGGIKTLRKDPQFYDRETAAGDAVRASGIVGSVAGCRTLISNRLNNGEAFILTPNCLTAFMKRDINLETEREMSNRRTKIGTDCHYVIAIEDFQKIVAIRFGAS